MKKKNVLAFALSASMLLGLTACGGGSASTPAPAESKAAEVTESQAAEPATETKYLKAGHVFAEGHPVYEAFQESAELLYEKTNGRYGLTVYPNGTYANYTDSITACQMGDLDIACLDSAADWLEDAGVLFAPYCFQSYEHWNKFKASDLYDEMREAIGNAVGGIKQLNMYNFGFRNLTANKEIRTLDDMQGLTLRCVNFAPYSTLADVYNVAITSIPIEDVYMSLQTGLADCEENPLTQIVTMKFYEVQKYLMMTQHMLACSSTIINEDLWNSLSDEDKAIFEEVFTRQGERIDELTQENEAALTQTCIENGMTVVDDIDTTPFRENAAKVVEDYPAWQNWYDQIQAMA
ncbi:TRAP transporter substrate-binding protein [Vermiculatibacterium agrestimuris]|uniref:TRAP transporter substrate-binding protein n=1 Tax=Vermiculatibacterium agrestimuris TaxID=2941519 RepID=UPI002041515F|nr:TRAP transporter substrate-binding protein DctP [Vermiculatibacterium agrestimuris]